MSFPVGNVDSSKPLNQAGKERSGSGSGSQHGPSPPSKRPRLEEDQRTSQSTENPLVNKGTRNIFYKTRLCKKKMKGECPKGDKCTFAHGLDDLRDPPPNWEELARAKSKRASGNYPRTPGGMMICRYSFSQEACPYGKNCYYQHESPKKTEMASSLPMNLSAPIIATTGPMLEMGNDTGKPELMKPCSQRMASLTINSSIKGKEMQLPLNSGSPCEDSSPAEVTETKFLNWRPPRKIAGIYGDWPEGYSLPDNK